MLNTNLMKVCELLSDNQYHDGTTIGNKLGITRAAVWKVIKKLQQYEVDLKSIKGKGYLLQTPLLLLNEATLQTNLKRTVQLEVLEKINSTNDYLKQYTTQNKAIRACFAEMQTQGKGRLNRQWHSPFGKNINFSLLYPFQKDISELSGLSLVVGLAICRAIEDSLHLQLLLSVKWPNDVLVDGQKISGTLIEIQAESNGSCQVIIGVGINVNLEKASSEEINQPWTSLMGLTGHHIDRNRISSALIHVLIDYIERFSQQGLNAFIDEWQERDSLLGSPVKVASGRQNYSGIGFGINQQGHFLLKMPDNTVKAFASGDTSIVKS